MGIYPISVHINFNLRAKQKTEGDFFLGHLEGCLLQDWDMQPLEDQPGLWTGQIGLDMAPGENDNWKDRIGKILADIQSPGIKSGEVEVASVEISINQSELERLAEEATEQIPKSWKIKIAK